MNINKNNHESSIVNRKSFGFTLIELLIVIAIIGVLATLLMVNFVGVRQRARDAQRKSDLRQLQSALEIYRSDNGSYPSGVSSVNDIFTCTPGNGSGANKCTNSSGHCFGNPACTTVYMQNLPTDPSGPGYYNTSDNASNYFYFSDASTNNASYILAACLENSGDSQGTVAPAGAPSGCATRKFYVLYNP